MRFFAAALHSDFLVGFIGGDAGVRAAKAELLEMHQAVVNDAAGFLAVAGEIQFGRNIVVVENEFFAQQAIECADEKQRVRRVVGMHHIEALPVQNIQAHGKAYNGKVKIFAQVACDGFQIMDDFRGRALFPVIAFLGNNYCKKQISYDENWSTGGHTEKELFG